MYNEQYINALFSIAQEFGIPDDVLYVYDQENFTFYGGYYFMPYEVDSDTNVNESFKSSYFNSDKNTQCILVPNPKNDLDIIIAVHEMAHYKLKHHHEYITPLNAEYEAERFTITWIKKMACFTHSLVNYYIENAKNYVLSYMNESESESDKSRIRKSIENWHPIVDDFELDFDMDELEYLDEI